MARFLYHSECHKCGSSDANANYDDGSTWCFSCRSVGKHSIQYQKAYGKQMESEGKARYVYTWDSVDSVFPPVAVEWLLKYQLTIPQVLWHNVAFDHKRNSIVFRWFDGDGNVVQFQTRNMEKKVFYTSTNHDNVLPIYYSNTRSSPADLLVVVEDCVSAIKIAELRGLEGPTIDAMPLLGSHLPSSKLTALNRVYSNAIFWLDSDKGADSVKYANRARMLGMDSHIMQTELDPKEYTWEQLKDMLK